CSSDLVLLAASNFPITVPDATAGTFTVSSVTHGTFQTTTDGIHWTNATTFTSADLAAHHVRFLDDGSDDTPTFSVQVDNGESVNHQSNLFVGTVNLTNDAAPLITAASFAANEVGSILLSASDFSITDPDATAFTFTVSSVTHGTFQNIAGAHD